ncbi:LysR family transcriptional regulator [Streptomyces sp. NPDC094154]|uniref:LysR family transcriptional regulator n=1 Tax=unclassified Streptomyces TaxID=2593676 RepID=UPI003803E09C
MRLHSLDYFLAVAELGSVSAAATRCYVSQPAVSRQIAALEKDLGVELFRRTSGGLKLSAAGRRFYPIARDIRHRVDRGTQVMRSLNAGSPELVAACPPTTMHHGLSRFIAERAAPIIDVYEGLPEEIYPMLEQRGVDMAVSTSLPPSTFASRKLADTRVSAQFRPESTRYVHGSTVELAELAGEKLLIPGGGSAIQQAIGDAESEQNFTLHYERTVSSSTIAQALAAAGRGCAIVVEPPRFGLHGSYIQVKGRPLTIPLYAAWETGHYAAQEISVVADQLGDWMRQELSDTLSMGE